MFVALERCGRLWLGLELATYSTCRNLTYSTVLSSSPSSLVIVPHVLGGRRLRKAHGEAAFRVLASTAFADADADCSGAIDTQELKATLSKLGSTHR